MTNACTLTSALGGRWHGGYGLAFCPAHQNTKTPALSLKDGDGGNLLAHCFSGCDARDVFAALRAKGLLAEARVDALESEVAELRALVQVLSSQDSQA